MPIRDRFRRAFGRSPSTSDGSDLTQSKPKSSNKSSKKKKTEKDKASDDNDIYYKLGEQPRPKYRGPYNRQHQEKLHAFSFSNAFSMRRKSQTSEHSPMGSRMPSRAGSLLGRESWELGRGSRKQSVVAPGMVEGLRESLDEGTDVGNVGLSRTATHNGGRPRTRENIRSVGPTAQMQTTNGDNDGKVSTDQKLADAMTKTSLKPLILDRSLVQRVETV